MYSTILFISVENQPQSTVFKTIQSSHDNSDATHFVYIMTFRSLFADQITGLRLPLVYYKLYNEFTITVYSLYIEAISYSSVFMRVMMGINYKPSIVPMAFFFTSVQLSSTCPVSLIIWYNAIDVNVLIKYQSWLY